MFATGHYDANRAVLAEHGQDEPNTVAIALGEICRKMGSTSRLIMQ
jgi:hypothetical protein